MEFKLIRTSNELFDKEELDSFLTSGFQIKSFERSGVDYGLYKFEILITIYDVIELIRLNKFVNNELILSEDTIEIYDGYRE